MNVLKNKVYIFYWLVFTILTGRLLFFTHTYAVDLFVKEQWHYLFPTIEGASFIDGFMARIGPHRIGLGYLFYNPVLRLSDFNNRPIAFMVSAFIIVNALLFTRLKIRFTGHLYWTDIIIPLGFFTLHQHAIILDNSNLGIHVLIFFLALIITSLLSSGLKSWKFLLLNLLIPLITVTGNGFFLVAALLGFSILALLKSKRFRTWWVFTAIWSAINLWFYTAILSADYPMDCALSETQPLIYYVSFVKGLVLNGLSIIHQNSLISWALFLLFTIAAIVSITKKISIPTSVERLAPLLIIGYVILFVAAAVLGRWCYGLEIVNSSRYVPQLILAFLTFLLLADSGTYRNFKNVLYAFALLFFFAYAEVKFYRYYLTIVEENYHNKLEWKACYLKNNTIETCSEKVGYSPTPLPIAKKIDLEKRLELLKKVNPTFKTELK